MEVKSPDDGIAVSAACVGAMVLAGVFLMMINAGRIVEMEPMQLLTNSREE